MKTLVSLDFASQETWEDMKCAVRTLFSQTAWVGSTARGAVAEFLRQSVYTYVSSPHVSLYFSGRAALRLTLQSLDLPSDAVVAVQAFTCTAVVLPVISLGYTPMYVDINSQDFSMDIEDLKSKYTPAVKVLILQHSFGIVPVAREEIARFCADHDIFLVEDLAHGFIPKSLAPPNLSDSYCALVSFGRSKFLSSVFGAAVITPNDTLGNRLEKISDKLPDAPKSLILRCLMYKVISPIIKQSYFIFLGKLLHHLCMVVNLFPREISPREKIGRYDSHFEYAYPEPLAQILVCQIARISKLLERVRARAGEYQKDLPHSSLPSIPLNRFPYLIADTVNRANILRHLKKFSIFLGTWYNQPVGPGTVDMNAVKYTLGSCPVAEDVSKRILNLPLNVDREVSRLVTQELNDSGLLSYSRK